MRKESRNILLTGVTGALGGEMIREILQNTEDKLHLLIRKKGRVSHWDRARKMLDQYGYGSQLGIRVHVLEGDVAEPSFGLGAEDIQCLKNEVTHFFHIAALTALNGSEEDCFRINLGGTENALALAREFRNEGKLKRFFYFSTAYVAGSLKPILSFEDELPENPAFANFYESSKYNAEKKVRAAMLDGLPATIFRPSIVVGDSKTGRVTEFNVIYPFMKMFVSGIIRKLPANPENFFNIVPIDFVIQASLAISEKDDSIGKTFHLVSEDPPRIKMLLEVKAAEFPEFADLELIDPKDFQADSLDPMEQTVHQMMQPYLGYLTGSLTFDTQNSRKLLAGTGVDFPKTDYEFIKTLTQFAVDCGYLVTP